MASLPTFSCARLARSIYRLKRRTKQTNAARRPVRRRTKEPKRDGLMDTDFRHIKRRLPNHETHVTPVTRSNTSNRKRWSCVLSADESNGERCFPACRNTAPERTQLALNLRHVKEQGHASIHAGVCVRRRDAVKCDRHAVHSEFSN